MGKKFRRITAVMTVMLLMLGTISSGFVDQIVADATKTSNIQRLHFGEKGTVLQLDRPISKNPDAIETIVNLANKLNEVKLFDINTLGAYVPEGQGSTLFGSTTDADPMGTGYSYIQFNEGTTEVHTANTKLNKVQDSYGIDDLALSFWCYNGSDSAEPLSTSDTGTFQISSNETVPSNNLIRYVMKDIQLQSGWNYIELPLSEWWYPYENGEPNLGEFDIHSIQSFAISGYKNINGSVRRFTDFSLVFKTPNEECLFDINTLGAYIPEGQGSTLFGSTTDADPMGTGYSYIQFNEGTTEVHTANTKLNKVQDSYGIDDLALSFWCYNGSDSAEPLSTSDTGTFQISSNETVPSNNLIRYVMKDIQLQSGWNYIELPLSEWYYPYGSGENLGKFDIHSIQSFAISGYKNANGTVRRFTNFELKPINSVVVKTVNANELSGNYMIFSNINVSGESAPYALFVTENGYPSVVYGDKQFTLNKNIATGNDVRLKVERDTDGYINFYVNDKLIRKSNTVVDDVGTPKTAHYIGCDGKEEQNFEGEIASLKIYEDSDKLMGYWNLVVDSNNISTIISDESKNANNAIYKEDDNIIVGNIPFSCDAIIQGDGKDTQTMVAEKVFDGIDTSRYNSENLKLVMDIEVENITTPNDVSAFGFVDGQIELTSSGKPDEQERAVAVSSLVWLNGKHEYEISIGYGNVTGGDIDYSAINYMRIYINKWGKNFKDKIRVKINNVRLVITAPTVSTLFSDGMIFQQKKPMNMWGTGKVGEPVVAKLLKNDAAVDIRTTIVDDKGKWQFAFSAQEGSYDRYTVDLTVGGIKKTINDIAIGELWIAGGQSNMELIASKDIDAEDIVKNADNRNVRIFLEPTYPYGLLDKQPSTPADDIPNAKWGYGDNGSCVGNASSVAYTFASKIQKHLGVPVGIINSAVGGSEIEGWISRDAVENDSDVKSLLVKYNLYYDENNLPDIAGELTTLYNQKIGPLEGMNVAGLIWYQGESNGKRSEIYDLELNLLKKSWSKVFGYKNGDMPLIFTQVAPYYRHDIEMGDNQLGYLSMYMERAWKLSATKNTAMLTVYDLPLEHVKDGESSDPIHPRTKTPVGERFAQSAINMVYGGNKVYTAPVYKEMEIKDGAIYITFDYVGEGLEIIGNSKDVHGFSISGEDGIYVNARAQIVDKNKVKVWNPRVENPQNAMYAFDNYNQSANLCNSEKIPASPFRTVILNDTTTSPDSSLKYFLPQDWMYADKDVWVYDLNNTEKDNRYTGYRPSFAVSGGTYLYDARFKSEGEASLKVVNSGDFILSPILSYNSINKNWSNYKTISAKVSSNNNIKISLIIKSNNVSYTVSTVGGNESIAISASEKEFKNVEFDLTSITNNGIVVSDFKNVLASIDGIEFKIESENSGEVHFDEFLFGMTKKIDKTEEIKEIINSVNKFDITNVKSSDTEYINKLISDIDSLLEDSNVNQNEKSELKTAKIDAEKLLDRIKNADHALKEKEIIAASEISKDNVKLSDKDTLLKAKAKLEEIVNGKYKNNYLDSVIVGINSDLKRIGDAIISVNIAESFIIQVAELPNADDVKLKDLQTIKALENVFNTLTENEKNMVGKNNIQTFEKIVKEAYEIEKISFNPEIIEGANQIWKKDSKISIKFRSNAEFSEFVKVMVDEKDLDTQFYTAKSGSTIVELNLNYLNTLLIGKHKLSIVSVNGHADTVFEIQNSKSAEDENISTEQKNITESFKNNDSAGNSSPKTGDMRNISRWLMLLIISLGLTATFIVKINRSKS